MTEHADQLREAFETHEDLAPDPAAVYGRVQELSRKYKRRRTGAQVAGGAALSVGLVAGVINLPAFLPGQQNNSNITMVAPAAAPSSVAPSPTGKPDEAELERRYEAYFSAGYDWQDVEALAKLWKMSADNPADIKAEAGRRLLAGETLPIAATPGDSEAVPSRPEFSAQDQKRFQAFFNAGYTWDEAEKLAKLWKLDDPSDAKLEAGRRLLDGQKLPVKPKPANVAAAKEAKKVSKFFEAGYDVDDAIKLAKIWKLKTAYDAKVMGGERLLAGKTLPIKP